MYVPNDYVVDLARQHPDIFLPVISLHPYRRDAIEELDKWAKAGGKFIKWLPNAMGMDPAARAIEPFYRKMKDHNMILLSHAGEEQARAVAVLPQPGHEKYALGIVLELTQRAGRPCLHGRSHA